VRGLYTLPDKEHVVQREMPAVLVSRWQAPDGRQGLALANISWTSQRVVWRSGDAPAGAPLFRINGEGRERIGAAGSDGLILDEDMPAHTVQVIEVGG
jgi:hypothetical protein